MRNKTAAHHLLSGCFISLNPVLKDSLNDYEKTHGVGVTDTKRVSVGIALLGDIVI